MKDERQKNNVYTEAEVRKYQELVKVYKCAEMELSNALKTRSAIIGERDTLEEILSEPAKKFIQAGWKIFWHGVFIKIHANPDTKEVSYATNWLHDYWQAKLKIDGVRQRFTMLNTKVTNANLTARDAERKVKMYLELFPGIDSAKLSVETKEETEEEES